MDNPWRLPLALLTGVGALVTILGLLAAYQSARRQAQAAGKRISDSQRLAAAEKREHDRRADQSLEINAHYENIYAVSDLIRPSYGNASYLAALESKRLLSLILDATRGNLLWAGAGLIISSAASITGLLVI